MCLQISGDDTEKEAESWFNELRILEQNLTP